MARIENKVLFGAANTSVIASGLDDSSDVITLDVGCYNASITVKADNSGIPVAGDVVDIFIRGSSGDPDGAAVANEYASADTVHGNFLCQLDTFVSDPAIKTVPIPSVPQESILYVINNGASSVTFSAVIEEVTN